MLRIAFNRQPTRTLGVVPRWSRCQSTSSETTTAAPTSTETLSEEILAAQEIPGRGVQLPHFHPRTHDVPVANIHFRSHHIRLLDLFTHFATHAASALGIPTSKVVYLPTQRSMWTVIRSPFAHKKSQENFERKVHKRAIKAWDADPEVVERWIQYMRKHALGGVGMRVTRWEHMPLSVGQTRYQNVEAQLEGRPSSSSEQIKALGEQILAEEGSAAAALKA